MTGISAVLPAPFLLVLGTFPDFGSARPYPMYRTRRELTHLESVKYSTYLKVLRNVLSENLVGFFAKLFERVGSATLQHALDAHEFRKHVIRGYLQTRMQEFKMNQKLENRARNYFESVLRPET